MARPTQLVPQKRSLKHDAEHEANNTNTMPTTSAAPSSSALSSPNAAHQPVAKKVKCDSGGGTFTTNPVVNGSSGSVPERRVWFKIPASTPKSATNSSHRTHNRNSNSAATRHTSLSSNHPPDYFEPVRAPSLAVLHTQANMKCSTTKMPTWSTVVGDPHSPYHRLTQKATNDIRELFKTHGSDLRTWPVTVRRKLRAGGYISLAFDRVVIKVPRFAIMVASKRFMSMLTQRDEQDRTNGIKEDEERILKWKGSFLAVPAIHHIVEWLHSVCTADPLTDIPCPTPFSCYANGPHPQMSSALALRRAALQLGLLNYVQNLTRESCHFVDTIAYLDPWQYAIIDAGAYPTIKDPLHVSLAKRLCRQQKGGKDWKPGQLRLWFAGGKHRSLKVTFEKLLKEEKENDKTQKRTYASVAKGKGKGKGEAEPIFLTKEQKQVQAIALVMDWRKLGHV